MIDYRALESIAEYYSLCHNFCRFVCLFVCLCGGINQAPTTTTDRQTQRMGEAAKKTNLFDYTEEQLLEEQVLTHYEILSIEHHASTDAVKKAYRKASLKYHPDKTGRGDDDYVFLAVKKAYDILSDHTKRSAYDSTALSFDDSIPPSRGQLLEDPMLAYKDEDFYDLFRPVFERNLRFDANLRPDAPGLAKKKRLNNRNKDSVGKGFQPPVLGQDDTPIEEVHKFYEYWIHFESWRDFTSQATEELNVENELENAESRFEKRWLQKEIDKRAKQLKTKENGRIQTLVERAMEADPRLRRERLEMQQAKERAKAEREAAAEQKKREAEEAKIEAIRLAEEEKERKAKEKQARDQEKKLTRKERQQLRRMTSASFEEKQVVWEDSYDMGLDVEYLCTNLNLGELRSLNAEYESLQSPENALAMIRERALKEREAERTGTKQIPVNSATPVSRTTSETAAAPSNNNKNAWTKDELSALAKAVKKYPPGGANRWDQIALLINNICRQDEPRSKEECIQKFNEVTRSVSEHKPVPEHKTPPPPPPPQPPQSTSTGRNDADEAIENGKEAPVVVETRVPEQTNGTTNNGENNHENGTGDDNEWTTEQDAQLQEALAKFPVTMEKNARWSAIADAVQNKSKKECVNRFKAIREALKNRK